MFVIRELNSAKAASFVDWRSTDQYMRQILEQEIVRHNLGMGVIFIAEAEENIVGTAQFVSYHSDRELANGITIGCLQGLEVCPKYRQRGIATCIIKRVEQEALFKNFQRLSVMVEPNNIPAFNLYRKLGFQEFKRSIDCWQDRQYPVVCLSKQILE